MAKINSKNLFSSIHKRDGRTVPFNEKNISIAILSALPSKSKEDKELADYLTSKTIEQLQKYDFRKSETISVEDVSDTVQIILIENVHSNVALNFIKYRSERRIFRESRILKEPILTDQHKKTLELLFIILSEGNGNYILNNPLTKELKELTSLNYLIIQPSTVGKYSVSLNAQKSIQIERIVTFQRILS